MKYQLIFDLATMFQGPNSALVYAAGIAAVVLVSALVMKLSGNIPAMPVKFPGIVAGIMLLVSGLVEYERRWILTPMTPSENGSEGAAAATVVARKPLRLHRLIVI